MHDGHQDPRETPLQPADHMYNMQVPEEITVEALMHSSLAPFIELAANDCELICNWVHPLFLKAKSEASKEDNPNWWQAMHGPFAEEFTHGSLGRRRSD